MSDPKQEPEIAAELQAIFERLEDAGRCVWRREVRILHWARAGKVHTLRADFIAQIDGSPLLAFEVKRAPQKAADLGRHLLQCVDYAKCQVAPATADRVVPSWVSQPIRASFMFSDWAAMPPFVREHAAKARRLFGPARVGFAFNTKRYGLRLTLTHENIFWQELDYNGETRQRFNGSLIHQGERVGNGSFNGDWNDQ